MARETELQPVAQEELERPARRLLKTWQEAELIRRMDEVIIASHGAYADRAEFLSEAIRDRLEAEEQQLTVSPRTLRRPLVERRDPPTSSSLITSFGDWLDKTPPTASALDSHPGTTFGMHNRDYPTLWAADSIGRLTATAGQLLPWPKLTEPIIDDAWRFAEGLQTADLDRPRGAKVAAGFPTNHKKRDAVAARFREHFLGLVDKRGPRGPMFTFGIAGVEDGDRVALTDAGVALLTSLHAADAGKGPPFSEKAWEAFAAHLASHAPAELEMWRRVRRSLPTSLTGQS